MKLTNAILAVGMTVGVAWAQNPDIIENTRNTMKAVQQKKEIDSNAALAASQSPSSKPSNAGGTMSSSKPASNAAAVAKTTKAPVTKQNASTTAKPAAVKS